VGNQAFRHTQNDVYGEMILAISRLLLDARFAGSIATPQAIRLVRELVRQIDERMEDPDAGLWELRGVRRIHAFTLLTHWAGARQAAEIGLALDARDLHDEALAVSARASSLLEERCWNAELGALTQAAGEPQLDAALLLALHFRFFPPDDPRAGTHVDAIRSALSSDGGILHRYTVPDDFGKPVAAFTVCSFWLVEALALLDRTDEARALFERLLDMHNGLGLYSEDLLPDTWVQSGNFPQTYSHVGLINAAFRLSRSWD
jgi:GH15 family glucan-1,4-alpha-glucosidase